MNRELNRRRNLMVMPIFEPDRMSAINLQVAYARLVPAQRHRSVLAKPEAGKVAKVLRPRKGVAV